MPTKHARIALSRDPELSRALNETKRLLDADEISSSASQVRALALRGAESVIAQAGPQHELRSRLVARHGLIPASSDLADLPAPEGDIDRDDPTPATDALDWVRGD